MSDVQRIDLTPTWGEWANIYRHFAESGEAAALKHLAPDLARMRCVRHRRSSSD